jgi:hypothetical protein
VKGGGGGKISTANLGPILITEELYERVDRLLGVTQGLNETRDVVKLSSSRKSSLFLERKSTVMLEQLR